MILSRFFSNLPVFARLAGLLVCLLLASPVQARPVRLIVHNEAHITHAHALVAAALKAGGVDAVLEDAPSGNEPRVLQLIISGRVHIDMVPASAERLQLVREGKLLMIPIPLERGLLGYRVGLTVAGQAERFANVQNSKDLKRFIIGQGEGWSDLEVYRHAGILTHEIKDWTRDVFARQIEAGSMDLYPLGVEETLSYFLDYYRAQHEGVVLEPHLILRYPWFRFVWVSPQKPNIYQALQRGFDQLVASGEFVRIWEQYRSKPSDEFFARRTIIDLANPHYNLEVIPAKWLHLLVIPEQKKK